MQGEVDRGIVLLTDSNLMPRVEQRKELCSKDIVNCQPHNEFTMKERKGLKAGILKTLIISFHRNKNICCTNVVYGRETSRKRRFRHPVQEEGIALNVLIVLQKIQNGPLAGCSQRRLLGGSIESVAVVMLDESTTAFPHAVK